MLAHCFQYIDRIVRIQGEQYFLRSQPCSLAAIVLGRRNLALCVLRMPSSLSYPVSIMPSFPTIAQLQIEILSATQQIHIPSIVVITPKHGFAFVWSGFRTRNLGRGGSLGAAAARASWFVVFLPATMIAVGELCCGEVVVNKISLQHFLYSIPPPSPSPTCSTLEEVRRISRPSHRPGTLFGLAH